MKHLCTTILLSAGLLLVSAPLMADGSWQHAVVNYSRQQYRSGNQNWQIVQNHEGWMYFANNKGLLEFDGANWKTYSLPGNAKVRSVYAARDGIYVGALGQFGRFVRNEKGRMVYERLSESVDKIGQLNVWNIHHLGNNTYFQCDTAIYINNTRSRIHDPHGLSYSAVVYNRLYVTTATGVYVLMGKKFAPLHGIDIQQTSPIVALLPYEGKLLLVSSERGLFLYDNNRLSPLHSPLSTLHSQLTCAAISDHLLALGTIHDGVFLFDLATGVAEQITMDNGLQSRMVLSAAFDSEHNLWLGLDNGIDCVPLDSPLRFLNSRQSPVGSGNCSMRYRGKLYLGSIQGLYEMASGDIRFIEGTGSQVLCIDTIDGKLFCGGRHFFLMIDGDRITRYHQRGVWGVRSLGYRDDVLLVSTYWGLQLMRRQGGRWEMAERVKGADLSAKTFYVEDGSGAVWVANKEKGLFRLVLSADLSKVASQRCYNSAQLPKGDNVCIAKVNGETVVASRSGLFRYDTTNDRLEPFRKLEDQLEGHVAYTYIRQDSKGRLWYVSDGTLHVVTGKDNNGYLNDYLMEDFENISFNDNGQEAIIGTEDGFAMLQVVGGTQGTPDASHISLPASQGASGELHVRPYIRNIYIGNYADTLYYGCKQPAKIAWRNNSLRLEYSTNNYDPSKTVQYSYWLEGSAEDKWSPYTRRRIKEYTNLHEGSYTFHLRVIMTGCQKPVETSFSFVILPPWYRTWWAYTLYVLLMMAAAYVAYRYAQKSRQRLVAKKNEQLQEKEEEIQEKVEEIETLREEKLELELRARQDELVRSRMNIVRKNEMLQEIKKTAVSLNNALPTGAEVRKSELLSTIKRRVTRLIGQIDTNIEHDDDLEAFKNSFDIVHHRFLQLLDERYPSLTHKEKMLCAYIRMNLLSKEIAPLLNISTRGVEISRYRIRQKLGLDTKDSLTDFLQHL